MFVHRTERFWDDPSHASTYDQEFEGIIGAYVNKSEVDRVIQEVEKMDGMLLLDAGCGSGRHLLKVPKNTLYIGVDTSLPMLHIAKQRAKTAGRSAYFIACDITRLPFKTGVYDGVMSTRVMQHIVDQGKAMNECARVTRKGGQVVVLVYNSYTAHCLWKCFRHSRAAFVLGRLFKFLAGGKSHSAITKIYRDYFNIFNSVPEMRKLFSRSGIRILKINGTDLSNIWLITNFRLAPLCERLMPDLLKRYLSLCQSLEERVSERFPFFYLMDKIVVKGVVEG
jgi:ubiquinone/menaquinone biosynthesis C-methylase UbiE